jgi:hypothetical protein|tara:strand:+ start:354 stop:629 length:276 start_codon:yes stop_codon:yes gene_type:complete
MAVSKYAEWFWKVFTVVLGVIIVPLAGWVWNTNVALAQLQNDLGDAEETVVVIEKKLTEAETNSRAIISIEKDIEYMKQTLDRIETLVSSI